MSYIIRNIRPSVVHIPDAGLRLDSGETAIVETLTPQMDELLADRALEVINPPAGSVPLAAEPVTAESSAETEPSAAAEIESAPVEPAEPEVPVKKTRKSGATLALEQPDEAA